MGQAASRVFVISRSILVPRMAGVTSQYGGKSSSAAAESVFFAGHAANSTAVDG